MGRRTPPKTWTVHSAIRVFGASASRDRHPGCPVIPQSLLEAARIDGTGEGLIFRRIMLALAVPSIAALSIFTLVNPWNSSFWPSIALTGAQDKFPLVVAVLKLKGAFDDDILNMAAGVVVTMMPILGLCLFAQRFFMRGLEGAVKERVSLGAWTPTAAPARRGSRG